jgi:hypothetical protein
MIGRLKRDQGQFFYSFCLDDVVPADHQSETPRRTALFPYGAVGRLSNGDLSSTDAELSPNLGDGKLSSPCQILCTENLVRFDLMTESLNVGRDGRADIPPPEPGRLDLLWLAPPMFGLRRRMPPTCRLPL